MKSTRKKSSEFLEELGDDGAEQDRKFKQDDLEVTLEEMADLSGPHIGLNYSFLALKNSTSYAIGTFCKGLKVMEQNQQIYSERFSGSQIYLYGLIYIDHLNCYLLCKGSKLYRKDIDGERPYFFMDLDCGENFGKTFRYSKLNRRLIVPKNGTKLAVVNLARKQVDILVKVNQDHGFIKDFKIFGRKENKIAWITSNCLIHIYSVNSDLKKIVTKNTHVVKLIGRRPKKISFLEVCDQGKYLVAGFEDRSRMRSSRMSIFQFKGHSLNLLSILEEHDQEIASKSSCLFFGRYWNHLIWVVLSESTALTYCFNSESGDLRELVGKRVHHDEDFPLGLARKDQKVFFTGMKCKLMRFSVQLK